jgi:hypothetical protein
MPIPRLVFVYNADSGLFNALSDMAHKLLSPQTYACNLCALTHGHFGPRREWTEFLKSLDMETGFLHHDEFVQQYGIDDIALPAVFLARDPVLELCIDADALDRCATLDDLKALLTRRLGLPTRTP